MVVLLDIKCQKCTEICVHAKQNAIKVNDRKEKLTTRRCEVKEHRNTLLN